MKIIFDGLPQIHSCRLAIVKDLPRIAMEAGNSVETIQRHYNKRATETEPKTLFALVPPENPKNILQMQKAKAA